MSAYQMQDILFDPFDTSNYIQTYYEPIRILGEGSYSIVLQCLYLPTQEQVAVKVINKLKFKKNSIKMIENEANYLLLLQHENIVKFIDSYETSSKYFVITELIKGHTLQNMINNQFKFTDTMIQKIIEQIALTLEYIHKKDIIHRDLKPGNQNIIIEKLNDNQCKLKIIDFGLSFKKNQEFLISTQVCGTMIYMAPEVIKGEIYNNKADFWSLGIIQWVLFSGGKHPFWKSEINTKKEYLRVLEEFFNNDIAFPRGMKETAQHFFLKTANKHLENRMNAESILQHRWITGNENSNSPRTMEDVRKQIDNVNNFEKRMKQLIVLLYLKQNCQQADSIEDNEIINLKFHLKTDSQESFRIRKTTLDPSNKAQYSYHKQDFISSKDDISDAYNSPISNKRNRSLHSIDFMRFKKDYIQQKQNYTPKQYNNNKFTISPKNEISVKKLSRQSMASKQFQFGEYFEKEEKSPFLPKITNIPKSKSKFHLYACGLEKTLSHQ